MIELRPTTADEMILAFLQADIETPTERGQMYADALTRIGVDRGGPTNLHSFRGRDKCNPETPCTLHTPSIGQSCNGRASLFTVEQFHCLSKSSMKRINHRQYQPGLSVETHASPQVYQS
jgi:hypothetical protein